MTNSETKAQKHLKKLHPGCYIKKIPDFKQMGHGAAVGLPDYVVFWQHKTYWYEIKSGFGDTLNLKSHLTPGQKITFKKMLDAGVDVRIYAMSKTQGNWEIKFKDLLHHGSIKFHDEDR